MNFLSRLFSQPSSYSQKPFENQLTETLVGICEHVPTFKLNFFKLILQNKFLLDNIHTSDLKLKTQSVYERKSIDIEMYIEREELRLLTIFVEVKAWSGENHSLGLEDDLNYVPQTASYLKILSENKYFLFGDNVALISLTPYVNKLDIQHNYPTDNFINLERLNFFWHDIGKLIDETIIQTTNEKELFLLTSFLEYLKESDIMSDTYFNLQDLATIDNYISTKKKMWSSLIETSTFLKNTIPQGGSKSSWSTASTQEQEYGRFTVYQYLNNYSDTGLCIFAGYVLNEEIPSVRVWLEGKPGNSTVQTLRTDIAKELNVSATKPYSTHNLSNDSWEVINEDKNYWWFLIRSIPLVSFANNEQNVKDISNFFLESTKEMLSFNSLKNLF